jgi:hypothetical protein
MTTEKAFDLIDGLLARLSGTRADHIGIMEALQTIKNDIAVKW